MNIEEESINDDASRSSSVDSLDIVIYPSTSAFPKIKESEEEDANSTSSSIDSINIIMHPTSILSEMDKTQKSDAKRCADLTSEDESVDIVHPSKSLFSQMENFKTQFVKKPSDVKNIQLNMSTKQLEYKTTEKSINYDMKFSSEKNCQRSAHMQNTKKSHKGSIQKKRKPSNLKDKKYFISRQDNLQSSSSKFIAAEQISKKSEQSNKNCNTSNKESSTKSIKKYKLSDTYLKTKSTGLRKKSENTSTEAKETFESLGQLMQNNFSSSSASIEPNIPSSCEIMSGNKRTTQTLSSIQSSANFKRNSVAESVNCSKNVYFHEIVKQIVQINPELLLETTVIVHPSVSKDLAKLPLSFDSYDEYTNILIKMMVLELWEKISKSYLNFKSQKKSNFFIAHFIHENGLTKVHCVTVVNRSMQFSPYKSNLVILYFKELDETYRPTFGFIVEQTLEPYAKEIKDIKGVKEIPPVKNDIWNFFIYVKHQNLTATEGYIHLGDGICDFNYQLKQTKALYFLNSSPMKECILSPDWEAFSAEIVSSPVLEKFHHMKIQNTICKAVYDEIQRPSVIKKIILLEGVPGSGKTEVIACLCKKLTESCSKDFKILVTAPSHCAVDNLANQIIKIYADLGLPIISFIRTGNTDCINPEHLNYSLHVKIEEARKKYEDSLKKWKLKEQSNDEKFIEWDEISERYKILSNSNIILSTFSDCIDLYVANITFSCCLIDEANQATELDSLFPFMFQNSKFFMVGDPKQLPPPVKSEFARKCGFQRSMFERFLKYFSAKYRVTPAIQLTVHYRMHGTISIFPFKTFYFENYSPPSHSYDFFNCSLKPYIVLDDVSTSVNSGETGYALITSLYSLIKKKSPYTSKAIIVPSNSEKLYLRTFMENQNLPSCEIGTVDDFQGQERRICIISCYTSNEFVTKHFSCKKRLNVSLTRASNCLIICGRLNFLKRIPYWFNLIEDSKARNHYLMYSHGDNITDLFNKYIVKHK